MGLSRTVAVAGLAALGCAIAADAGEIRGTVRLEGAPPAPAMLTAEPSPNHPVEGCGAFPKLSQRLLVDAHGGVQNALVWVEMPLDPHGLVRGDTKMLDQRECVFEPHVLLLPAGGTLALRNSDPMLHNVRIFQERTMLMHEWQQPKAADLTWRFNEPGRYLVRCGVHSWMYAWIVVAEHRYYALTDSTGGFTISDVPQGGAILRVWHEALGERQQPVRIQEDPVAVVIQFAQATAAP